MPELPIVDDRGMPLAIAPVVVMATTFYPGDEDARYELLASGIVRLASELGMTVASLAANLGEALIPFLYHGSSHEDIMRKAIRATQSAWVADTAFEFMLRLAKHYPDRRPEISRAFWLIDRIYPKAPSDRTKWRIWKNFRCVAHLNIATGMLKRKLGIEEAAEGTFRRMYVEHLLDHLALAEAVRTTAVEYQIVVSEETWYAPKELPLERSAVRIPPLSPEMLKMLAKYIPPASSGAG